MPTEGALTGRDEERATIQRAGRAGHDVVLTGPAGMGATTLVAAAVDDGTALWVTGTPGGRTVPLGALRPLLGAVGPEDALVRLRETLEGRGPIVVDDARHLDDTTTAVLGQVARAGIAPLVVVATGPEAPSAVGRLARSPAVVRIHLSPLPDEALALLARTWTAAPVEGRSLRRLLDLAAGRPAVLRELVDASLAAGTLVPDGPVHRLADAPTLSPALVAQIAELVGPLSERQVRALELLVVAGRLDLAVADDLAGNAVVAATDLEAIERRHLVAVVDEELVLTDPLVAEAVGRDVGRLARRRLNRDLAEAAERVGFPSHRARARHQWVRWAHGGGLDPDPTALHDAARSAAEAGDVESGAELAWAAFAGRGDPASALLAAWCRARGGTIEALLAAHAAAAEVAVDPWDRAVSAQQEASARWWAHDDLTTARSLLDPSDLPDGPWWKLLAAQGAMFDFLDGSIDRGLGAVAEVGEDTEDHTRFLAALAQGLALALADRGEEAVVVAEQAYADAQATSEELYGNGDFHALAIVMGLMYGGRLAEADGVAALLYAEAVRRVEPNAVGWAAIFAGSIAFLRGDLDRARVHLAESEAAFLSALLPGVARWAVTVEALVHFAAGDTDAGDAARDRLRHHRPDGFGLFAPLERLADAWSAHADARLDDARSIAVAAAHDAAAAGAWSHVAHIVHDLARFGCWEDAARALASLPSPHSALTRARAAFVTAGAGDDGDRFDAAAEDFVRLGAPLFAAEAAAGAVAAHRRAGRRRQATASATRLTTLLAFVPGAATPPLRLGGGVDLTAREHEVVTLAISGRTNRAIAHDLGITERTVENHLHRAFAKLGVGARSELRAALDAREALGAAGARPGP